MSCGLAQQLDPSRARGGKHGGQRGAGEMETGRDLRRERALKGLEVAAEPGNLIRGES